MSEPARSKPDSVRQDNPLLGIGLAILTVFLFAISDVLSKYVAMRYPADQVVAVRYLAGVALLMVFVFPRIRTRLWRTARPGMLVLRGLALSALSISLVMALKLMPVGETVAIIYLSPIAVMLLAIPLFGEKVKAAGWVFALIGFAGVLLIVRPGHGLNPLGVAFALMNAAAGTALHLLTRHLARADTAVVMLFYATLTGAVIFGVWSLPALLDAPPAMPDLLLMVAIGAIVTGGHFLFAQAYMYAPASLVAPVQYVHLVWAALLGWIVFGHLPDELTTIGMLMIVVAGVALALQGRARR